MKQRKNFGKLSRKNSKIYGFRTYVFKKLHFFGGGGIFNKDYTFYTKNLFFTTKDAQSFVKISFFSNKFTFLSVMHQNLEYNLRILANFHVKTQNLWISPVGFQKTTDFFLGGGYFNKDYTF